MNYLQQSTALFGSLKNAVLGNPVTREFTIGHQIGSFGPGLLWKVFDGKKKTTGQDVSIFIFEKACVDQFDRRVRDLIFEKMRHGPQQLTKLRHPRVLTVQHPLEESRDSLAFATEPVFASLSNVLGKQANFSNGVPDQLKDFELYAVEKVYGLLQVVEGLSFIHNDANLNEGNLTTDNIIITKGGQWKLAGFHFSKSKLTPVDVVEYTTRTPPMCRPDLNYLAPEWIFAQQGSYTFDICKADMFSFGCLMSAVYNHLKTPFDASDSVPNYKKSTEQLSRFGSDYLKNVPINVREHVQLLINVSADTRPDAQITLSHPFYDDVAAMTLKYLDSLVQRDEITKSQFFKNLYHVLDKLPLRVLHQRILPPLFSEFPNHMMIPFVLPNVFAIAKLSSKEEFGAIIFPEIRKIFHVTKPVEVLLILMQRMELLLAKCNKDDVKNFVLPLIFRALESPSLPIQELVLGIIPDFVHMIDYSSLKNAIIPRMKVVVTKTSSLAVCVNTLVCFGKIIEHLDKFLLVDEIFPALTQIPSRDPAVLMGILGIYKQTMNQKKFSLEKDYLATKAIPFLLPLAVEPTLNVKQFNNFMSVIRDMFDRVEQEHRTKLEQLQKMKDEQRSSLDFVKASPKSEDGEQHMKNIMNKVDDLVVGKYNPNQNSTGKSIGADSEFSKMFGLHDEPRKPSPASNISQTNTPNTLSSTPKDSTLPFQSTMQTNNPPKKISPLPFQSSANAPSLNINTNNKSSHMMMNNLQNMTSSISSSQTGMQSRGQASPISNQPSAHLQYSKQQQQQSFTSSTPINMSSFDQVLSPQMSNFKSEQQSVPMGTLQQQQQRQQQQIRQAGIPPSQPMQPTPINFNQHPSTSTPINFNQHPSMLQSQTQSITMFQTQTQMFPHASQINQINPNMNSNMNQINPNMNSNMNQMNPNMNQINPNMNSNMNQIIPNMNTGMNRNMNSNVLQPYNNTSTNNMTPNLSSKDINDLLL